MLWSGRRKMTPRQPSVDDIEWRVSHFLDRLEVQLVRLERIVQEKRERDGGSSSE